MRSRLTLRSLAPVVLCALSGLVSGLQKGTDEFARERELFQSNKEEDCRAATDACVTKNSVAAVELLFEVLGLESDRGGYLPSAHYRDIVWDGLRRIVDPYARGRVEQELLKNKKDAWMRQWCAELLGEYGDAAFGPGLLEAMHDKDLGVKRAAARALGKVRCPGASKALAAELGDRDIYLRANAVEALARIDLGAQKGTLLKGLKDADGGVRCALLAVAAELLPDQAEALATSALADEDWRPRLQAVEVLGTIRTKSSIDQLIRALGDARPAVTARALKELQGLTGFKHTQRPAWEGWWKENRETFAFPPGRAQITSDDARTVATYNGVRIVSDHAAFLLDRSAGMGAHLKSKDCSKEEAALAELEAALTRLQGKLTFNLFTYAEHVTPFEKKGPIELTARAQERALKFARDERCAGSKNIWQALEAVIVDPDLDTVFLLSTGEPEIGTYVHWNRVTWHLQELNRFQKVVIHTIAYSDNEGYRGQLQKIAEATGGEFVWFE